MGAGDQAEQGDQQARRAAGQHVGRPCGVGSSHRTRTLLSGIATNGNGRNGSRPGGVSRLDPRPTFLLSALATIGADCLTLLATSP